MSSDKDNLVCYTTRQACPHFRQVNNNTDLKEPSFTGSKLTIETLEQGVKYVQS